MKYVLKFSAEKIKAFQVFLKYNNNKITMTAMSS
jgi:hypothetical protein